MDQPFNPRYVPAPAVTLGLGGPFDPPPSAFMAARLGSAFWRGVAQDIREKTKDATADFLSSAEIVEEVNADEKCVTVHLNDGEMGSFIAISTTPDGYVSVGLTLTTHSREPARMAALLDFAAAGLAAMDQHALSNGWQS